MSGAAWFGAYHGAPYESETEHVPTPVGEACAWCAEPIAENDDGLIVPLMGPAPRLLASHYECFLRQIVGGLNHQRGSCVCCGGTEPPDPPELTTREAARQAVAYFYQHR